jgi:uncharacterized protein YecT (DUF1311 family)
MINRLTLLRDGLPPPPDRDDYGDFYVVAGAFGSVSVTAHTACAIEAALDANQPVPWIAFRDRSGSRIRVRACDVRSVCESTAAQRAYDRRMERARELEERADRNQWEDD